MASAKDVMISGYHDLYWVDRVERIAGSVLTSIHIGSTGPEGIRQNLTKEFQEIKSDATGPNTTVDTVAQGGNCTLEFVLQDLNLIQVRNFLAPARSAASAGMTSRPAHQELGLLGHLSSTFFGVLYAVPVLNTPADVAHQDTKGNVRQYYGHVIGDMTESLDSTLNAIPIRFLCLPFEDGDTPTKTVWFDWATYVSVTGTKPAEILLVSLQTG